jgi:hypothetical protein
VSGRYTVTVRRGPKVKRERYDDLGAALAAMERAGIDAERHAGQHVVGGTLMRKIEPVQQVVARIELKGPVRLRAGIDVRGDGSTEAFTGKLRRELIRQRRGETSYRALARLLRDR